MVCLCQIDSQAWSARFLSVMQDCGASAFWEARTEWNGFDKFSFIELSKCGLALVADILRRVVMSAGENTNRDFVVNGG